MVLEKTLESPLDCKEIKPVNLKRNQFWIFIGRTDAEAEAPTLWPPDAKNWLTGKDPDAGKDWRQEEKETTEDEMVGWHHWLDGHEFEQTLGVGNGQESLACCSPWGHKELDTTEQLNWTESTSLGEQDRLASYIHVLGYIRMLVIFILPNDAGGQQRVRLASKGWNDSSEKLDCNGTTAGHSCFLLNYKCFHRCQFPDSGIGRNILCVTDTENITQVPQEPRDLCPCACNTLSNHKVYPLR